MGAMHEAKEWGWKKVMQKGERLLVKQAGASGVPHAKTLVPFWNQTWQWEIPIKNHGVLNRSMIRGVHTLTGGDCQALSGGCLGIREVIMDAENKWYPLVI